MEPNWFWLQRPRHMSNEYVQVARRYRCPRCIAKAQPKAVRVATLHKAPHFNHTVAIDTFYVEWDKEKKAVFTILMSSAGTRSTVKSKMRQPKWSLHCLTPPWAKSFGYPKIIRMDASGPHQGELFAEWASNHGIKVNLIPRGAHHRLGILERNQP